MWWGRAAGVVSTGGTEATPTGATSTQPMPADQGLLLLSASPWGDLDRIVSKANQQEIPLTEDSRSTPARIKLEPGEYSLTMTGPGGRKTMDVSIEAGRPTLKHVPMGNVDFDALAEEVSKQR